MKRALLLIGLALVVVACDDDVQQPFSPPRVEPTPFVAPPPPPRAPTGPAAPAAEPNDPPVLRFSVNPDQPSGPAPRVVTVNMCGSTDPEGEPLVYQYKWGGGAEHFSYFCRFSHTYETPGSFRAFFCVHDEHDHQSCANQRIDITP